MSVLEIKKEAHITITTDELDDFIGWMITNKILHDQYVVGSIENPRNITVIQTVQIVDYLADKFPFSTKEIKKMLKCEKLTIKEGY